MLHDILSVAKFMRMITKINSNIFIEIVINQDNLQEKCRELTVKDMMVCRSKSSVKC